MIRDPVSGLEWMHAVRDSKDLITAGLCALGLCALVLLIVLLGPR